MLSTIERQSMDAPVSFDLVAYGDRIQGLIYPNGKLEVYRIVNASLSGRERYNISNPSELDGMELPLSVKTAVARAILDLKSKFVADLRDLLSAAGYKEGDWEDGYTEDDVEKTFSIINGYLTKRGLPGRLMIVWSIFSEGSFGGDSDLYYHFGVTPTEEHAYPISYPLFEDGLENFAEDLLILWTNPSPGRTSRDLMAPFAPEYVKHYSYNAAWQLK